MVVAREDRGEMEVRLVAAPEAALVAALVAAPEAALVAALVEKTARIVTHVVINMRRKEVAAKTANG